MPRKRTISLAALLICCIGMIGGGQAPPAAAQAGGDAGQKTAAELQQQLIAAAEEGRGMAKQAYFAGQGSLDDVNAWTKRWIAARLLAATNKQSRIEILSEGVKAAQEWEDNVKGQNAAGVARPSDIVAARYIRIEAELALATERSK